MVCYSVPASAAILLYASRKGAHRESQSLHLLNLLLGAGAIMLIIDHYWNGELFLIGPNLVSDLMLGVMMTLGVVLFWGLLVFTGKISTQNPINTKAQ